MARRPVRPGPPLPRPEVQPEDPGSWLVDLSHIELDPRLPSAFNPDGTRPIGPAWYQTHTVAYAQELGYDVRPIEAYLRRETGAYLDPWHDHLKTAYVDTLADLGPHPRPVRRGIPRGDGAAQGRRPCPDRRARRHQSHGQGRRRQAARAPPGTALQARQKASSTTGITFETRARFGCTAPVGTTDDRRFRRLTVHLPAAYAQRLFDARNEGATDQQMGEIIAEGFKEVAPPASPKPAQPAHPRREADPGDDTAHTLTR